jgi:hypothetical protein
LAPIAEGRNKKALGLKMGKDITGNKQYLGRDISSAKGRKHFDGIRKICLLLKYWFFVVPPASSSSCWMASLKENGLVLLRADMVYDKKFLMFCAYPVL